jgi:hypothetical protein
LSNNGTASGDTGERPLGYRFCALIEWGYELTDIEQTVLGDGRHSLDRHAS